MTSPVSVTAVLKQRDVPLPAASALQMMHWSGLIEEVDYTSSSGSGAIKRYLRLTEHGLAYGVNLAGARSKEKTEVPFIRRGLGPSCDAATAA